MLVAHTCVASGPTPVPGWSLPAAGQTAPQANLFRLMEATMISYHPRVNFCRRSQSCKLDLSQKEEASSKQETVNDKKRCDDRSGNMRNMFS